MKSLILLSFIWITTKSFTQTTFSSDKWLMYAAKGEELVKAGEKEGVNYLTINKDESMFTLTTEEKKFNYIIYKKTIEANNIEYSLKDPNGEEYTLIFDFDKKMAMWIMTLYGDSYCVYYLNLKTMK